MTFCTSTIVKPLDIATHDCEYKDPIVGTIKVYNLVTCNNLTDTTPIEIVNCVVRGILKTCDFVRGISSEINGVCSRRVDFFKCKILKDVVTEKNVKISRCSIHGSLVCYPDGLDVYASTVDQILVNSTSVAVITLVCSKVKTVVFVKEGSLVILKNGASVESVVNGRAVRQ
jgi:hypothetical protein